jgi:hypothetical protein
MLKEFNKKTYVTKQDMARTYQPSPSFVDRLPWRDYNESYKCFLLEDNISLGACFKISPISCEARPASMMEDIAGAIAEAIKNTIPCEKGSPWILQVYAKKQPDLSHSFQDIDDCFPDKRKETPITKDFLRNMKEHLEYVSRSNGIFHDSQVTNLNFRGGILHIYAVLYRRHSTPESGIDKNSRIEDITRV